MAKKIVFIIAQNNFRDEELLEPKKILENRNFIIKIASKTRAKAFGKIGTEINPDLSLAEIKKEDFDAVIFIGGAGARQFFNDQQALEIVKVFRKADKIIGGICIAPMILANAGVLIGKRVTAFPAEEENLKSRGAEYTGMQVETDGRIVTAKDPSAAKEFGEKLAYLLEE